MKTLKNIFNKIKYAILPFLLFLIVLYGSYWVNQVITSASPEGSWHWGTTWAKTPLDDLIPLIPEFIYIYHFTFLISFLYFFYLAYKDKRKFYDMLVTLIISFAISGVIYFLFNTYFVKPDFEPTNFTDNMVVWVWNSTNPTNCFPSQHCFMALALFFACVDCKSMNTFSRVFGCICGILVVLSTVFTKQHYALDFVGSLVIFGSIFYLTKKSGMGGVWQKKFDNFYEKIRKKFKK